MNPILIERAERRILMVRGQRVMLDSDLAKLYGVTTFNLNKAVKRNWRRFPSDFMFQLSPDEHERLIFQSGISKAAGRGGRRHDPYVFTEHGVAMLSSVLRSERAIRVNIAIMRAFAHLRELLASHRDLAHKLEELEQRYDGQFKIVFDAIRDLMEKPPDPPPPPPEPEKERMGFGKP